MTERGLIVAGELVPDTDWILRDPRAWWKRGERGTRARAPTRDLLVGHWTAGRNFVGPAAGPTVVRNMKARKRADGSPMEVGIDFIVSWDGLCWQTSPFEAATVHAGRMVNPRSIGVECCWPGTAKWARQIGITPEPTGTVRVGSQRLEAMLPSRDLIETWVRLAELLASLDGLGGIRIERRIPPDATRFSPAEQRRFRGAQEHCHVPGSTKVDAAGLLVGALADAGWAREAP